jgi:hypothetical protein
MERRRHWNGKEYKQTRGDTAKARRNSKGKRNSASLGGALGFPLTATSIFCINIARPPFSLSLPLPPLSLPLFLSIAASGIRAVIALHVGPVFAAQFVSIGNGALPP